MRPERDRKDIAMDKEKTIAQTKLGVWLKFQFGADRMEYGDVTLTGDGRSGAAAGTCQAATAVTDFHCAITLKR